MTKITTMALENYDSSTEIELPKHQYDIVAALRSGRYIIRDKYFNDTFSISNNKQYGSRGLYYNDVYSLIFRGFIDAITLELTDFGKTVNCYWYKYKLTYNSDRSDVVKSETIKHYINNQ